MSPSTGRSAASRPTGERQLRAGCCRCSIRRGWRLCPRPGHASRFRRECRLSASNPSSERNTQMTASSPELTLESYNHGVACCQDASPTARSMARSFATIQTETRSRHPEINACLAASVFFACRACPALMHNSRCWLRSAIFNKFRSKGGCMLCLLGC